MTERRRAIEILQKVERESAYASLLLRDEPGFVRAVVLGVLRWRSRIDWEIARFAKRKIDPSVVDVLRTGVYQLRFMDVPVHAAVNESVDLAPRFARGFVNAVLRKVAGSPRTDPPDAATRLAHPPWLLQRWTGLLGAERAEAIAAANQELSYPDVLALGSETPEGAAPSSLVPHVWRLASSSAHLDREDFWPMDEGSAVVAAIAAKAAGDSSTVLDVAAAPGSKSLYLRTCGVRAISNDLSITRLRPLARRGGLVTVSDGRQLPFRRFFDVVLLDAPCSATGTIRKNPEIKWRLREEDLPRFARLQGELLASALRATRRLCIYSTCSLEAEENDAVTSASAAELEDITPYVPAGVRGWVENGVLRLTPESGADGFTVFALRPLAARGNE